MIRQFVECVYALPCRLQQTGDSRRLKVAPCTHHQSCRCPSPDPLSTMRRTAVLMCAVALVCAVCADAAGSAVAALGCGSGDCCYSGAANAQRFCACADAFRRSNALTVCATVRCAAGPPPGECEKLLAVPPAPATPKASDCVCTKEYMPVCVGGKTFGNACEARCACIQGGITAGAC